MAFWSAISERLASLGLWPRTRMARLTAYLAGIELVLLALKWIFRLAGATRLASPLDRWTTVLGYVVFFLVIFVALRWFRNHVMWSVRNRLIVTYLFIGGVPIVLVLIVVFLAARYLTPQFSAYIAVTELTAQSQRLQAANAATAQLLAKSNHPLKAQDLLQSDNDLFPGQTVEVFSSTPEPKWLKDGFHGLVVEQGRPYLRAADFVEVDGKRLMVISSVPIDQKFVAPLASKIGPITLYVPKKDAQVNVTVSPTEVHLSGESGQGISAGSLPPQRGWWDTGIPYFSELETTDWNTGETNTPSRGGILLTGATRLSALYSRVISVNQAQSGGRLFGEMIATGLVVVTVVFSIFVLLAWIIGFRLTRTVTYSVANLYKATEHINQGDFTHRIKVRQKDQLAALQTAFNSMTESVQKLIAEQKEKERLQSELEIAHEVQAQLFPREFCGTRTLEMHGVCRPARIVSGDYYDFLAYGPEQVGIAVGDISGKGISAALLMATIHSAVRAYEQELMAPVNASSAAAYATDMRIATIAPRVARPSPAQMLWLLNRHLYQTTQPEKYATLFLGFYDDDGCSLTYSNAGHLPPVILSEDGSTRRLDVGGTVVGLFDERGYEEQTVELYPGDIFIAFSDGMTEPENEFGEFGEERLIETIAAHRDLPLERICEMAVSAVQDWIGSTEQPDDVTLVLARRMK